MTAPRISVTTSRISTTAQRISVATSRIPATGPRISTTGRGRVDRAPAALPAAPSVVAIATTRQITISTIPHIIIYIRAATLLYMAALFVVHGYPSCYIRCPLCLQVCPLHRTYYPLCSSVSHSHSHAASHQSNFVTRNTSIKLRNNHFNP